MTSPTRPKEISQYINSKMSNKQQAYNNIVLDGNRAFVAVDYAGLEIVDISNPRRIRHLGWYNPWKADTLANLWLNSPGHMNQLAYDSKRKLIFASSGDSEMQVIDVASSRRPKFHSAYGQPKNGRGMWGLTLHGNTIYSSYIRAVVPFQGRWAGLTAIQINH